MSISTERLGRLFAPDSRDERFPLRALLPTLIPQTSRFYATGPVLDQGDTPRCVAFAWKQWLDSMPIKDPQAMPPDPQLIYDEAQAIDEWAGTPHDGTSVRAGAKVIEQAKRLGAYHWSSTIEDVRAYIVSTSTVVFGTDWYDGMFEPTHEGFVKPTGAVAGGHAYLGVGYSQPRGAFRCINSWGVDWAQRGRFWIAGEDLQKLLDAQGEACAGVEIKL